MWKDAIKDSVIHMKNGECVLLICYYQVTVDDFGFICYRICHFGVKISKEFYRHVLVSHKTFASWTFASRGIFASWPFASRNFCLPWKRNYCLPALLPPGTFASWYFCLPVLLASVDCIFLMFANVRKETLMGQNCLSEMYLNNVESILNKTRNEKQEIISST